MMAPGSSISVNTKEKKGGIFGVSHDLGHLWFQLDMYDFNESKSVLRSMAPHFLFVRKTLLDFTGRLLLF